MPRCQARLFQNFNRIFSSPSCSRRCEPRVQCHNLDSFQAVETVTQNKAADLNSASFYPDNEIRRAKKEEIELLGIAVNDKIASGKDPDYQFFVSSDGKIIYKTQDATYQIDKPESKLTTWPQWQRISGQDSEPKHLKDLKLFLDYESQNAKARLANKKDIELANSNKTMTDEAFNTFIKDKEIYVVDNNLIFIDNKIGKVTIKHNYRGGLDASGQATGTNWSQGWENFASKEFLPPHYLKAFEQLNKAQEKVPELSPSPLDFLEAAPEKTIEAAPGKTIEAAPEATLLPITTAEQKPRVLDLSNQMIQPDEGSPLFLRDLSGSFSTYEKPGDHKNYTIHYDGEFTSNAANVFSKVLGDDFRPVPKVVGDKVHFELSFSSELLIDINKATTSPESNLAI